MMSVEPTAEERGTPLPGDDVVIHPDVRMDRAFTVDAPIHDVWPWIIQLGKKRAGWYFPRFVERFIPPGRRGARAIDARYQSLKPGDVIPDYGGSSATFEVDRIEPGRFVSYRSVRGATHVTWTIQLRTVDYARTRLHFRLILGPIKHRRLAETGGGFFDWVTILGMAQGLRERLAEPPS